MADRDESKTDMVRRVGPIASITDVELSGHVPVLSPHDGDQAWLFVRLFGEPIGIVVVKVGNHAVTAPEVLTRIRRELGPALGPRLAAVGLSVGDLRPSGFRPQTCPPFVAGRQDVIAAARHCTVVICTRDRPDGLRRAMAS